MNKESIAVIAGMPRAATTFLYHTLANHPRVFVPARKEIEYFSLNFGRGQNWYLEFFRNMSPSQFHVGLDVSPMYFFADGAAERIRRFNPEAKVILSVRDPAEFVFSFYQNRLNATLRNLEFNEFLTSCTLNKDGERVVLDFTRIRIADRLASFSDVFGRNLLLCDYSRIDQDPLPGLQAIQSFLDLPKYFTESNVDNVRVNSSKQKNSRLVNVLMHQRWFSDLVVRTMPKKWILAARYKLQTTEGRRVAGAVSEADQRRVQSLFAEDARYIRKLFATANFVLGDGSPLPL